MDFSQQSEIRFVSRLREARGASSLSSSLDTGMRVLTRMGPGQVRRACSGSNGMFVEIELDWGGILFAKSASLLS